jgi:hypothetical protein
MSLCPGAPRTGQSDRWACRLGRFLGSPSRRRPRGIMAPFGSDRILKIPRKISHRDSNGLDFRCYNTLSGPKSCIHGWVR